MIKIVIIKIYRYVESERTRHYSPLKEILPTYGEKNIYSDHMTPTDMVKKISTVIT